MVGAVQSKNFEHIFLLTLNIFTAKICKFLWYIEAKLSFSNNYSYEEAESYPILARRTLFKPPSMKFS